MLHGEGFHALVGYDPGVYYAAADAFVHGRPPYEGFLLLHPPGIMLFLSPFAALGSVTSDSTGMAVARFAVILLGTLNAVLVAVIARRFGRVAALVGGLFYATWIPEVVLETLTKLEPFGNTCLLVGLAVLLRPRPTSARMQLLAGAALGAGAGVKIWGVVPLLVVLGWQLLDRGWRSALKIAVGAGGGPDGHLSAVLPGGSRRDVPDGRHRPAGPSGDDRRAIARLYNMSSVPAWMPYSHLSVFITAAVGLLAIGALVLAWQERLARVVVVLLLAQTGLLLEAPSYFPAYAGFVVPAAALTLAAASGRVAAWLGQHGRVLRVAGVAALGAAVAAAGMTLVPIRVGAGRPFLGSQLGAPGRAPAMCHVGHPDRADRDERPEPRPAQRVPGAPRRDRIYL